MSRPAVLPLPLQIVLWTAANSVAGAAVGLAVGAFRDGGIETPVILISVLFGNVVGFTALISSVVLFPWLRLFAPPARIAVLGLLLLSGAAAGTAMVLYLFPLFILRDLEQVVAIGSINGVLALIVGSVVYVYEGLRHRLAESLREVEEVRLVEARLEEQAARAKLAALQARINPHFFFNTLNTISSLLEAEPARAEEMVQKLADLFRYTFRVTDARPVPLDDELRFLEGYLTIEQARFGSRLQVIWDVDPQVRRVPIPGLLLQPLVENALGHGLAPLEEGGTLRISARRSGDDLEIEVRDDGTGGDPHNGSLFPEGHGLDNIRQRLQTLYPGRSAIRLEPNPDGRGLVARLVIPVSGATDGQELTP